MTRIRARFTIDLLTYELVPQLVTARMQFLSDAAGRRLRHMLLTETEILPDGADVVVYVSDVYPSGELNPAEWIQAQRLNLAFEGPNTDALAAWCAAAAGHSPADMDWEEQKARALRAAMTPDPERRGRLDR